MPIRFSVAEPIPAPPDRVFAGLTDLDGASAWMPGLIRIERLDGGGPLEVGSRWRETRRIFGREATEEFEVTHLAPPTEIRLRVDGTRGTSKRGEYLFRYELRPRGDAGTDVRLDGEIGGLGRVMELVGRLMAGPYRKACLKDLRALSAHLGRTDDDAEPRPAEPAGDGA